MAATTGTTTPYFIPMTGGSDIVRSGKDYFLIQIVGAQAVFRGSIWNKVNQLIVASSVNLNHSSFNGKNVRGLQRCQAK